MQTLTEIIADSQEVTTFNVDRGIEAVRKQIKDGFADSSTKVFRLKFKLEYFIQVLKLLN